MAKKIVHCRICGESFDRNGLIKNVDWVMPVTNFYYHKKCYDEYQSGKQDIHSTLSDELWFNASWDYLHKDLKADINYYKMKAQWANYLTMGFTAKGMYFSLKYFYDIAKGDVSKCRDGIGIMPHIYTEGTNYWGNLERNTAGVCAAIENQVKERMQQKTITVSRTPKKKKHICAAKQLEDIMLMEDDND